MRGAALILALVVAGCGGKTRADRDAGTIAPAPAPAPAPADATPDSGSSCLAGMIHVTTTFCPEIERRCLDLERDDFNKIAICHAFAHEQRCKTGERPMDFCIDAYEYPNERGAHPVWMLSWPEAQAT
ncbi:MAG: hypothetical protein ACRENE_11410, partial [Polyangiaceae bacterium]